MKETRLDPAVSGMLVGLRGFFLADPNDLSLLSLIEQIASGTPGKGRMYRIAGGNARLTSALAAQLRHAVRLRHEVLALRQARAKVTLLVRTAGAEEQQIQSDYVVITAPASKVRALDFDPPFPPQQRSAIARLRYGPVTKTLLQCDRRFWRRPGRPLAYGTDLSIGAIWDANEEQRGRLGILCLMAGGAASGETQDLLAKEGPMGVMRQLDWLGSSHARLLASVTVTWEQDPWVGGGYATFDPRYDPALRQWLPRPHGRIFFAGEHTSFRWQGYMNGAVESGLRAAAEVQALAAGTSPPAKSRSASRRSR
jgi:monoamine oxidase